MGTYISRKRVERDGRLVAFAGEAMTEVEAKNRGLLAIDKAVVDPAKAVKKAEAAEAKKAAADEKAAEDAAALEAEKIDATEAVIATAVPGGKRPGRESRK